MEPDPEATLQTPSASERLSNILASFPSPQTLLQREDEFEEVDEDEDEEEVQEQLEQTPGRFVQPSSVSIEWFLYKSVTVYPLLGSTIEKTSSISYRV